MTARNLTVAITGASGSIFPKHLLDSLDADERVGRVNLIVSDSGLRVMAEELGISGRNEVVGKLLGRSSAKIQQQNNDDIGANVASGSYRNRCHDRLAVQHGDAGAHRQWHGQQAYRARRRRLPEGAAAADSVRARDAIQPHSPAQHDAGGRGRSYDLPDHSGVSTSSRNPPRRSRASS